MVWKCPSGPRTCTFRYFSCSCWLASSRSRMRQLPLRLGLALLSMMSKVTSASCVRMGAMVNTWLKSSVRGSAPRRAGLEACGGGPGSARPPRDTALVGLMLITTVVSSGLASTFSARMSLMVSTPRLSPCLVSPTPVNSLYTSVFITLFRFLFAILMSFCRISRRWLSFLMRLLSSLLGPSLPPPLPFFSKVPAAAADISMWPRLAADSAPPPEPPPPPRPLCLSTT
mmetsp:Transcript_10884/g.15210  ORF Transcript_10884/g.15210 Transcript_10884/m.15210 type:complete len:228 (+) Transcript_10884:349-1032(+)